MPSRLLIVVESEKRSSSTKALPAIERFHSVNLTLRKYIKTAMVSSIDIIVLSTRFGAVRADENIPYYIFTERKEETFGDDKSASDMREKILPRTRQILRQKRYSEV